MSDSSDRAKKLLALCSSMALVAACSFPATAQQTSPSSSDQSPSSSFIVNDDFRPTPSIIRLLPGDPQPPPPSPLPPSPPAQSLDPGASYEADCNDPSNNDHSCAEPLRSIIDAAQKQGYPYYIGHAEPTSEFFSTRPVSGNNMQWKFQLPATEPTPDQAGTRIANFELFPTLWIGLALCDPNSKPYGSCVAVSDANNPNTAGAAFLELQFYPPGLNCSNTQWCVRLHINTLQDRNMAQTMGCFEPTGKSG